MSASSRKRRVVLPLTIALIVLAGVLARPVLHLLYTVYRDRDELETTPVGDVDDASRLNQTKVGQVWRIALDLDEPERQLAQLLAKARADGRRVAIAGARHSMGGHTIAPGGIVIDMLPFRRMEWNEASDLLAVQAGALWSDVIPYLDRHGRSVAVMQSNNSFSVGGSISVNCHG